MQVPLAVAGSMVSAVAATTPLESLAPRASRQLSTVRSDAEAVCDSLTVTVVGTVTVAVVPLAGWTVTDVPVTAVTRPPTKAALGLGVGAPERVGAPDGRAGKVPPPPGRAMLALVHAPLTAAVSRTEDAVTAPVASLVPVITTHEPVTMSAVGPVLVWVIGVVLVNVTLTSPLVVLRVSVVPLICTSWPDVPPPPNPPRWPGVGVAEVAAAVALPQPAMSSVPAQSISLRAWIMVSLP